MTRRILLLLALSAVAGTASLFVSAGAVAGVTVSKTTPVTVTCTSTGQVCDQAHKQDVTTSSQLRLSFQTAWNGCASFSVSFHVDGVQVYASSPLGPFESTGTIDVSPVSHGPHALEVRATGVSGGCNEGTLQSWAGMFTVTTTDDPPVEPPEPESEPEPAPPAPSTGPTSKDECKKDGWRKFESPSFKNQGECVSAAARQRFAPPVDES